MFYPMLTLYSHFRSISLLLKRYVKVFGFETNSIFCAITEKNALLICIKKGT